jgi:hypothetical protein
MNSMENTSKLIKDAFVSQTPFTNLISIERYNQLHDSKVTPELFNGHPLSFIRIGDTEHLYGLYIDDFFGWVPLIEHDHSIKNQQARRRSMLHKLHQEVNSSFIYYF